MSGLQPPLPQGPRAVSHPTCCCSVSLDRCDRCDLLVDLEGFHLMSVARTPDALVLDVESCNQLVGCPGCGVIAQGHGHMVAEVIDAPWAGIPVRIRWYNRALTLPRTHLPDRDLHRAEPDGVRPQGVARHPGDPLGNWRHFIVLPFATYQPHWMTSVFRMCIY